MNTQTTAKIQAICQAYRLNEVDSYCTWLDSSPQYAPYSVPADAFALLDSLEDADSLVLQAFKKGEKQGEAVVKDAKTLGILKLVANTQIAEAFQLDADLPAPDAAGDFGEYEEAIKEGCFLFAFPNTKRGGWVKIHKARRIKAGEQVEGITFKEDSILIHPLPSEDIKILKQFTAWAVESNTQMQGSGAGKGRGIPKVGAIVKDLLRFCPDELKELKPRDRRNFIWEIIEAAGYLPEGAETYSWAKEDATRRKFRENAVKGWVQAANKKQSALAPCDRHTCQDKACPCFEWCKNMDAEDIMVQKLV